MKVISVFFACILSLNILVAFGQTINPDSVISATKELHTYKKQLLSALADPQKKKVPLIQRMIELGMWKEASLAINQFKPATSEYQLLSAEYFMIHNEFKKAEILVHEVLNKQSGNEHAILLKADLEIQAWRLQEAVVICEKALKKKASEKLLLTLGRAKLLQKKYKDALAIAKSIMKTNPKSAGAYLLESDIFFWDQQPELAEPPLRKSLELDPFNADARFSYGYAIWRRIDARQLNAMAAQWELALAINPLHYQTHWHWGNGHTNLTYADYAEKDDELIRKALEKSDDLVRQKQIPQAIELINKIEKQYPTSVLPRLHKASLYYIAYDIDRKIRLDSAENIFRDVLERKKHYGPAHNGLSAVIKSKRIEYLSSFDSINNELNNTKISDIDNFQKVFPDVSYYPGDQIKAMAWNQLYTSVVYFPFLSRQNNSFRIPPLHKDLAITMNSPYFRFMTTFDNRQWMDIRGVGSGAAAIEYVERGAFMERNVILHEYVHLFHGRVLTDSEKRSIKALYYKAMKEKRTLDYYSQNNESEYFAQTYPAYFEPVKVHPLDFKSMNTTSDLKSKDPEMYQFIDQLVKKERAYLAGDKQAMASNWSQIYLNLSNNVKQRNKELGFAYLDTALQFDQKYLPVYLAEATLNLEAKNFKAAEEWIKKAESIRPGYAPVYVAYSELRAAQQATNDIEQKTAIQEQAKFLNKAFSLEDDYQELSDINRALREMYKSNSMISEAIVSADQYVKNGAIISTYLRDQRNDAIAFSAVLRSGLGHTGSINILKNLVDQKPQNYEFRNMYADALSENKQYDEAILTIKEAQRILAASGNSRADFNLRLGDLYHELGKKDSTDFYIKDLYKNSLRNLSVTDKLRFVRLLNSSRNPLVAEEIFKAIVPKGDSFFMSDYYYTKGLILESQSDKPGSLESYEKSVNHNSYNFKALRKLIIFYEAEGNGIKADELKSRIENLNSKVSEGIVPE
jgi:Flp pilus assembly protein TadD